jgi:hypothetical protein
MANTASIRGSAYGPDGQRQQTEPDQSDEFQKLIPPSNRGSNRVLNPKKPNGLIEDKPNADGEDAPLVEHISGDPKAKANKSCCGGGGPKILKAALARDNTVSGSIIQPIDADDEDLPTDAAGQTADPTDLKKTQAETLAEEERMLGSQSGKLMVSGGYYIHENLIQFPYATDAIPF